MPRDVVQPLFTGLRDLPKSIRSEQAILGAILARNQGFHEAPFVKEDQFADPIHAALFRKIKQHIEKGEQISPVILKEILVGSNLLEPLQVAGQPPISPDAYITQLITSFEATGLVRDYGRELLDKWKRREAIPLLSEAHEGLLGADLERDASAQIRALIEDLMDVDGVASADLPSYTVGEAARAAIAASEAKRRGDATGGVASGFRKVDEALGELLPEFLYLLAGRPGMGKTSLAIQIAVGCARALKREQEVALFSGGCVIFYCLEMPAKQVGGWAACQIAQVDNQVLNGGDLSLKDAEALRRAEIELDSLPLRLIDATKLSGSDMAMNAQAHHRKERVRLVLVDHLQKIMARAEVGREGMTAATSKTTSAFKDLARSLKIPVIALAQLSRDVDRREDKRPMLSDLMYAGEQDADVVAFLYRAERYLSKHPPEAGPKETDQSIVQRREHWHKQWDAARGRAELIIAKRREGPEVAVTLGFKGQTTSFYEIGGMVDSFGSPALDPPLFGDDGF